VIEDDDISFTHSRIAEGSYVPTLCPGFMTLPVFSLASSITIPHQATSGGKIPTIPSTTQLLQRRSRASVLEYRFDQYL